MSIHASEPSKGLASMVVFVEGQDAFEKGLPRSANPYRRTSEAFSCKAWDEGWLIAAHRND